MSLETLRSNLPSITGIKTTLGMAPSLPKTFKAAVFKEKGQPFTLEDVELKYPAEGEILIKVLACGICGTDDVVQSGAMGNPLPLIPGHEIVGTVVELGPGEKKWKVGDRVGGSWHGGHDGTCLQCNRGNFQMCENETINGVFRNGGYAEYCNLRTEAAVRISPDADPATTAPLLCAGVTVFNGMRHMEIPFGETVAIHGLGGLGHLALQYASKMGYRVVALSSSGSKEKFARELGASDYLDGSKEDHAKALQNIGGAAMIVATAADPKIIGPLVNGLKPRGKLLVLAPVPEISVPVVQMVNNALSVHGWPSGHALDCEEAVEFANAHNIKCMIEKFPLAKAKEAFEHTMSGKVRFRSVLVME